MEKRFSKDDLLTTMTLYWVTDSFVTSARYYYEAAHNPWKASHQRTPAVEAPTAVGVFPADIMRFPRGWMERHFNLLHWKEFPAAAISRLPRNRRCWSKTCANSSGGSVERALGTPPWKPLPS